MLVNLTKNRLSAFFFFIFTVVYGVLALDIDTPFGGDDSAFTPQTLPFALTVFGVALSLAMIAVPGRDDQAYLDIVASIKQLEWKPVLCLIGLMIFYGFAMPFLGFIPSTIIFLIGGFMALGERNVKVLLIASIPLVIGFWFILTQLLGIYLNPGDFIYLLGLE